jgi:hypothetical protein
MAKRKPMTTNHFQAMIEAGPRWLPREASKGLASACPWAKPRREIRESQRLAESQWMDNMGREI